MGSSHSTLGEVSDKFFSPILEAPDSHTLFELFTGVLSSLRFNPDDYLIFLKCVIYASVLGKFKRTSVNFLQFKFTSLNSEGERMRLFKKVASLEEPTRENYLADLFDVVLGGLTDKMVAEIFVSMCCARVCTYALEEFLIRTKVILDIEDVATLLQTIVIDGGLDLLKWVDGFSLGSVGGNVIVTVHDPELVKGQSEGYGGLVSQYKGYLICKAVEWGRSNILSYALSGSLVSKSLVSGSDKPDGDFRGLWDAEAEGDQYCEIATRSPVSGSAPDVVTICLIPKIEFTHFVMIKFFGKVNKGITPQEKIKAKIAINYNITEVSTDFKGISGRFDVNIKNEWNRFTKSNTQSKLDTLTVLLLSNFPLAFSSEFISTILNDIDLNNVVRICSGRPDLRSYFNGRKMEKICRTGIKYS